MLVDLIRYLTRKKFRVVFNDLSITKPASAVFGLDRGTPIDRYYIERFLGGKADLIRDRVLEIGDSRYSRRFGGGKVKAFEVLHADSGNRAATIVGDLTDITTLPAAVVDCFICTQTFNFVFDVQKAVQGAHHVLKPGGVLLATVAGISQVSRYDMDRWGDYWRFTTASIDKLFHPVFSGGVTVESFGNVLAATAFLQGIAVEDLPDPGLLDERDGDYQLVIAITARKA
jgi:SAM-dependent methyltransferase